MPIQASNQAYLDTVRRLSERIIEAQRPIRILDAIKWNSGVRQAFFDSRFHTLPAVDRGYYAQHCPLGFDPETKRAELHQIERDISRQLGQLNPLGMIMRRTCREYQMVARMLEARGTEAFADLSQELYGASSDVFHAADPTIADLGRLMEGVLEGLLRDPSMHEAPKIFTPEQAVAMLNDRMTENFPDAGIRVIVSDGIAADAAAGTDYIKLRQDAMFSQEDIDVLEVHEGWVHLGTTLNGMAQPYCTFLSKGPPSATITQEGLAVLSEILSLRSSPTRLHRLVARVRAVTLAEEGADFVEVFRYLREKDVSADDAWVITSRVFRGSTPTGRPFTKDITYMKGFVLTYNFLRLAVSRGRLDRLPMLFLGKILLEDIPLLAELVDEGVVAAPRFIPPHFSNLKGLVTWLSFSRFIAQLSFEQLEADYAHLL
ncbi:MAG TPA: flavohemoglobin expression-modulating QEGLA motif protein [Gammaproteobacteria bacterium]|nr:flavohemoglobin expression-modulating QEGLA motif protein [Gammaproteobacteria bacterium]